MRKLARPLLVTLRCFNDIFKPFAPCFRLKSLARLCEKVHKLSLFTHLCYVYAQFLHKRAQGFRLKVFDRRASR
jgi:hypothetical protein